MTTKKKTVTLTQASRDCVRALFRDEDVPKAEQRLEECAESAEATLQGIDRILFAIIRVSGGSIEGLEEAIRLFRADWRDLLVAADFANDTHAHEKWRPRRLDAKVTKKGERHQGMLSILHFKTRR